MGSQSHKRECLCATNLNEKESVDLKLACGHISKLLLEVAIDLGLNLIVKLQFSYSGIFFFYLEDS